MELEKMKIAMSVMSTSGHYLNLLNLRYIVETICVNNMNMHLNTRLYILKLPGENLSQETHRSCRVRHHIVHPLI